MKPPNSFTAPVVKTGAVFYYPQMFGLPITPGDLFLGLLLGVVVWLGISAALYR